MIARLELLAELPIVMDFDHDRRAWREVLSLARAEKLTAYDASYLDLAMRFGEPLATRDAALLAAAKRLGVPVLP